ncbi:MAG: TVP38/TMEM64 family protein [Pseudomonadales bacterium]
MLLKPQQKFRGKLKRAFGIAGSGRIALLAVLVLLVGAFFAFDLGRFLNLDYLQAIRADASAAVTREPLLWSAGYFVIYVLVTALSLPGAAVMTLAGGAIFGMVWGLVLVSFASSVGATLAMLVSRTLLRDWVQSRFGAQLGSVNRGLEQEGGFYLFSIRMVPLLPFFVVNLVMGLTPIGVWAFYWVSQLGMLAGTAVYVFAGTQLATVTSVADVLSPGLIAALSLLGLLPLLARKSLGWLRQRAGMARPDQEDN